MLTFSIQDNYASPSEPTEAMTFSSYGLSAFQVQYWDGSAWQTVSGGSISSNNKVWRKVSFANVTTDRIRIYITGAADGISRLAEVEAYGFGYDAAGNVINDGMHTYQYDSENRLVSVDGGATASYGYDQQNRRYKKTVGSTVTHYVWQGAQVLSEHNGGTGAVLVDYIGGGKMKVGGSTASYFLSDRLSVRLSLDASGNVVGRQGHLPFGEDFAESGTQQKQHFTSYERDSETGTDYAVNRQYNQSVGRFNRVDPVQGSISMPQSLNRYTYTQNNPISYTDPDGRDLVIAGGHLYLKVCSPIIVNRGTFDDADLEVADAAEYCELEDLGSIGAIGRGHDNFDCVDAIIAFVEAKKTWDDALGDFNSWVGDAAKRGGQSAAYDPYERGLATAISDVLKGRKAFDAQTFNDFGTQLGNILKDAHINSSDAAHAQQAMDKFNDINHKMLDLANKEKQACGDVDWAKSDIDWATKEKQMGDAFFKTFGPIIESLIK